MGFRLAQMNAWRKKTVLGLTLLVAVAPLAACGSNAANTGSTAEAQGASGETSAPAAVEITNVSYDPTRELYEAYNKLFQAHWKEKTGQGRSERNGMTGGKKPEGREKNLEVLEGLRLKEKEKAERKRG